METEPWSLIPTSTLNSNLEHDVDNLPGLYLYIRDLGTFLTAVISLTEQVSCRVRVLSLVCLERKNNGASDARVKAAKIWFPTQSSVKTLTLTPAPCLLSSKRKSMAVEHVNSV